MLNIKAVLLRRIKERDLPCSSSIYRKCNIDTRFLFMKGKKNIFSIIYDNMKLPKGIKRPNSKTSVTGGILSVWT